MSVDDGWVAVGATGVSSNAGAIFAFRLEGGAWVERGLFASGSQTGDILGSSVDVDGDWLVAGAPGANDAGSGAGAAIVFRFDGTNWLEDQRLVAVDGRASDRFGSSVAISGDRLVVGAPEADDAGFASGKAYVYTRVNNQWELTQTLVASDALGEARYGTSVSIQDKRVAIASPEDPAAVGGAAYIYDLEGQFWTERKVKSPNPRPDDGFGLNVALDLDRLVVGALSSEFGSFSGSAHVFREQDGSWQLETTFLPPDQDRVSLGASVGISGKHLLLGAPDSDRLGIDSGSAYVHSFDGAQWLTFQTLFPRSEDRNAEMGRAVAIDDGLMAIAGPRQLEVDVFAYDNLALETGKRRPRNGDPLVFETRGGLADQPVILFVVEVNGQPFTFVTAMGRFTAAGEWILLGTTPPGLAGLEATFQSVGLHQPGALGASTRRVLEFR